MKRLIYLYKRLKYFYKQRELQCKENLIRSVDLCQKSNTQTVRLMSATLGAVDRDDRFGSKLVTNLSHFGARPTIPAPGCGSNLGNVRVGTKLCQIGPKMKKSGTL